MGYRVARPITAFSDAPTGKNSRPVKDEAYLNFIRSLPCLVTKRMPVEAAHVSYPEPKYGKLGRGKGTKESDRWAVPLCPEEHAKQHSMNEQAYWQGVGIDPVLTALSLYGAYPNEELATMIVLKAGKEQL